MDTGNAAAERTTAAVGGTTELRRRGKKETAGRAGSLVRGFRSGAKCHRQGRHGTTEHRRPGQKKRPPEGRAALCEGSAAAQSVTGKAATAQRSTGGPGKKRGRRKGGQPCARVPQRRKVSQARPPRHNGVPATGGQKETAGRAASSAVCEVEMDCPFPAKERGVQLVCRIKEASLRRPPGQRPLFVRPKTAGRAGNLVRRSRNSAGDHRRGPQRRQASQARPKAAQAARVKAPHGAREQAVQAKKRPPSGGLFCGI